MSKTPAAQAALATPQLEALRLLLNGMLQELEQQQCLPRALAEEGLRQALDSGAALPTRCFAEIYQTANDALAAHLARSSGQQALNRRELELLCRCLFSCRDLEDALGRAVDFAELLGKRGCGLRYRRVGAQIHLQLGLMPTALERGSALWAATLLFSYQQLLGWLIGEPLRVSSVLLPPSVENQRLYQYLFNGLVEPGEQVPTLCFSAQQLSHPIIRSGADLEDLLGIYPFLLFGNHAAGELPMSARVRAFINAALAQDVAVPLSSAIARALAVSDSTLRRRLRLESTSYAELRDRCLQEAAIYRLQQGPQSVEQIGVALGFSDSNAFRRAFHRWTGQSPSAWRERHGVSGNVLEP